MLSPGLQLSTTFLRQSQWAAAYDSVWALVLAYHRILRDTKNVTLYNLRQEVAALALRGLAVSGF